MYALTEWDKDISLSQEEEYKALIRALKLTDGFDLLFIRCLPSEGVRLIKKIRQDLPTLKIEELHLEKPINDLYHLVEDLENKDQIEVLFITGIEKSLVDYIKPGYGGEGDYYKQDTVPPILGHLNINRELFRDKFSICFVFIVPLFALKYFAKRAQDFFDWKSGIFEFEPDEEALVKEYYNFLIDSQKNKQYKDLSSQQRNDRILKIQDLIEANNLLNYQKANLLIEQGDIFGSCNQHKQGLKSYEKALAIDSSSYRAWINRGIFLIILDRPEEAIKSYDKALEIKPDLHEAWFNKGLALRTLGQYQEEIKSYDKALEIKPDFDDACLNRDLALKKLSMRRLIEKLKSSQNVAEEELRSIRENKEQNNAVDEERLQTVGNKIELINPLINEVSKRDKVHNLQNESQDADATIEEVRELRKNQEKLWRETQLLNLGTSEESKQEFKQALWWFSHQGGRKELPIIQILGACLPETHDKELQGLIELTQKEIESRLFSRGVYQVFSSETEIEQLPLDILVIEPYDDCVIISADKGTISEIENRYQYQIKKLESQSYIESIETPEDRTMLKKEQIVRFRFPVRDQWKERIETTDSKTKILRQLGDLEYVVSVPNEQILEQIKKFREVDFVIPYKQNIERETHIDELFQT